MNKLISTLFAIIILSLFQSCIKDDFIDDFVEPELRITNTIDTLAIEGTFELNIIFFNNVGQEEDIAIEWSSSDDGIISVDEDGMVTGHIEGQADIIASTNYEGSEISILTTIVVKGEETIIRTLQRSEGVIETTTFYTLEGDFELLETESGIRIEIADNYQASSSLPGLYIYLSNNRNSIANAHEIGAVDVFSGEHVYDIEGVGFNDFSFIVYFCKPFNVKVGEATL